VPRLFSVPPRSDPRPGLHSFPTRRSSDLHARRVERLTADSVPPAAIERIHAPIGLSIGAASPAEIAVAVLAQIIEALRSRGLQRSEEHTSELQSRENLVCRLLLEKKKQPK